MVRLLLRSEPAAYDSLEAVEEMLKKRDFQDMRLNRRGGGVRHVYEVVPTPNGAMVLDHATGLMWQKSCSSENLTFEEASDYVTLLNTRSYGGYDNWRMPTLEEVMSLMEPDYNQGRYIDPVFDPKVVLVWTADTCPGWGAWLVHFTMANCEYEDTNYKTNVLAVRSLV